MEYDQYPIVHPIVSLPEYINHIHILAIDYINHRLYIIKHRLSLYEPSSLCDSLENPASIHHELVPGPVALEYQALLVNTLGASPWVPRRCVDR